MPKEELEKEAEKRCSEYFQENCYKENRWADTHDLVAMYLEGYNKTNGWHYPSKGDMPERGKRVLLYTKTLGAIFGEFCNGEYDNLWTSSHCDFTTDKITAWMEIPKPSKEIKE
jgi:hypothetical protein